MNRDIEKRTAEFLAKLDPLFQQRPVYPILLDDDVPPFFVPCGRISGWTSPWCDLLARSVLERQGRWNGRGFAFFLEPPPAGDWSDPSWLGMVCHEAGHYLTFPDTVCTLDYDNELECIRRVLAPQATPEDFERRASGENFWEQKTSDAMGRKLHPADWIRATLHLTQRSFLLNLASYANPWIAAQTCSYGYPPGWLFNNAIEDEAKQRRDEPIRDILATDAPPRFTYWANSPPDG
jgi:hypothetical protein